MIHRTIRITGMCVVGLAALGLTGCDIGPVGRFMMPWRLTLA